MVSFAKQWEELLEKEKKKVEELQELKKQDIVVEEIEENTKTRETLIKDYHLNNFAPDKIGNGGSDNQEIIENEKGPPNEEEKENNKEQFRKCYTFLDNYIKDKKISFASAYIYTYLLNDYTVKKDYAKRFKKKFEIYQDIDFKNLSIVFDINRKTLKNYILELVKVELIELQKVASNKMKIKVKKPISREWLKR